jgi:hypothetical protein
MFVPTLFVGAKKQSESLLSDSLKRSYRTFPGSLPSPVRSDSYPIRTMWRLCVIPDTYLSDLPDRAQDEKRTVLRKKKDLRDKPEFT